jgi:hypothetical protein
MNCINPLYFFIKIEKRCIDGTYFSNNPDLGSDDSKLKAKLVTNALVSNLISPSSIAELGCSYQVFEWHYSRELKLKNSVPLKTKVRNLFRVFLAFFNKVLSVQILGSETLVVLAKAK